MKQASYYLHYRQDFSLLVIDAFQYDTNYYNVDYTFLYTNPPPIFSAYLSKKGLQQASNLAIKYLLHDPPWKRMFLEGRKLFPNVDGLKQRFAGRASVRIRIQRVERVFQLFHELGKSYFFTDDTSTSAIFFDGRTSATAITSPVSSSTA